MPQTSPVDNRSACQAELERQLTVCNACRYCEGLCAVFPAMERRRTFNAGDLDYLANLCHECGACYYACQYVPPHEFAINTPVALGQLREETYSRYVWPGFLATVTQRSVLWTAVLSATCVAAFLAGNVAWHDSAALFGLYTDPGAFYELMPHNWMVALFGAAFVYALVAISVSTWRFWKSTGPANYISARSLWQATWDACTLRYLDGGGAGCMNESDASLDRRRLYHHWTFYGFLLCFASTTSGAVCHFLGSEAPYPLWHPTVVLGILGGIGLIVGPLGLLVARATRDPALADSKSSLGTAFIWMLIATSATGFAVLALRSTSLMGLTLAIHLGVVFALFLTLPYGKFVHAAYRFVALVRHAEEQRRANAAKGAKNSLH